MKITIDIPDPLYRRLTAQAALEGRSVRDVTIELYEGWLLYEDDSRTVKEAARGSTAMAWSQRWSEIGAKIASADAGGPTIRDILTGDRR